MLRQSPTPIDISPLPKILFLDYHAEEMGGRRKLAGIRRFAQSRGWDVVPISPAQARPADIRPLLKRHRPAGCVVERASWDEFLPPRLFGETPVVYLDPQDPGKRLGAPAVVCDNTAVAELAFRELAAGMPPCLGTVPSPGLPKWNFTRIKAFKAQCDKAGITCHVFDGKRNEDPSLRIERLARWLSALPRRSGIFGTNDNAARDVVAAAIRIPRHIPKELIVLGVDASDESDFAVPVSSVKLDLEQAGYLAARLLTEANDGHRHAENDGDSVLSAAGSQAAFGPLLVIRRRSTQGAGRREPRIMKAVDIIRREAANGLTAASLTAQFPGSRKHFERRFREAMGRSVLDEILHVRLGMVLDMLCRKDMPIDAIADFSGFGSQRGLRKLFRSRFGMSMDEWRRRHGL